MSATNSRVVQVLLPKLEKNRQGTPSWINPVIEVTSHRAAIHACPIGIKTMDGPPVYFDLDTARELAVAILAAVAESKRDSA